MDDQEKIRRLVFMNKKCGMTDVCLAQKHIEYTKDLIGWHLYFMWSSCKSTRTTSLST